MRRSLSPAYLALATAANLIHRSLADSTSIVFAPVQTAAKQFMRFTYYFSPDTDASHNSFKTASDFVMNATKQAGLYVYDSLIPQQWGTSFCIPPYLDENQGVQQPYISDTGCPTNVIQLQNAESPYSLNPTLYTNVTRTAAELVKKYAEKNSEITSSDAILITLTVTGIILAAICFGACVSTHCFTQKPSFFKAKKQDDETRRPIKGEDVDDITPGYGTA